jgi:long-chain acyl-CoA synthetase
VKLPITAAQFDSFLNRTVEAANSHPESDAVTCQTIADGWRKLGLRPGDLVLVGLPNGKLLLQQVFGILLAGGVPAMVTPMTPAARLRELVQMMGAWAIAALRLPNGEFGAHRVEHLGPIQVALLPPTNRPVAAAGEIVLLTSGTSGLSSGCVFDFESLLLNAQRHAESIGQRSDDVVLISLPLYFSFALVAQTLSSLIRGNKLVISGPPFFVPNYVQTVREHGVTVSSLTPFLIKTMLKAEVEFPDCLRTLGVGGDTLAPDLVDRLLRFRPGKELYLTYGLTQAGPRVSTLAAHAEPPRRYASVGRPLAGTTVFLRDTTDGSGLKQLYVTSATVMKRLIGRKEGRAEHDLLPPKTIATGDVFEQDEEGYLYYRGRLSDYISRKGEKTSLAAVRRVAGELPHVVSAKTVIVKSDDGTEDFDLELRVTASSADSMAADSDTLLRGLLRRADMPRKIRIVSAAEALAHQYK